MIDYGLKDRVVLITGANNPQGIGAAAALAFAREGSKVAIVYKRLPRPFDKNKADRNGTDRYFQANAGNAEVVEGQLKELRADYLRSQQGHPGGPYPQYCLGGRQIRHHRELCGTGTDPDRMD